MTLVTDFGVAFSHNDLDLRVKIPNPVYFDAVEGICGDNNGEPQDDYRLKSGEILPFTPLAGYQRHSSMKFFVYIDLIFLYLYRFNFLFKLQLLRK